MAAQICLCCSEGPVSRWWKPGTALPASDEAEISFRELGLALCEPGPCCVSLSAALSGSSGRIGFRAGLSSDSVNTKQTHGV